MIKKFFADRNGKIVLWQWPNAPLYGWFSFNVVSRLVDEGNLKTGSIQLSRAFLFAWAYLEFTKGVSLFRRALGLVVLLAVIIGYFKK